VKRTRTLPELLRSLQSKTRRGARAVQPEDLLAFVALGDPAAVPALRAASSAWPRTGRMAGTERRLAPLGRWADYACAALEGGCQRVVELARDPGERRLDAEDGIPEAAFALGVLKEIRSQASIRAVLALASDARSDLAGRRSLAIGCAGVLNDLLCFDPRVAPTEPDAGEARTLLHALLALDLTAAEAGIVCCALRGAGDETSLEQIARLGPLPEPWSSAPEEAARAIRTRLRAGRG